MSVAQTVTIAPFLVDVPQPLAVLERFRNAPLKIAIQKDGELTEISREIISNEFGVSIPPRQPEAHCLLNVSEDGQYGFMYTRNKDICNHVASGAADVAIVGLDRLIEDKIENQVIRLRTYEKYAWNIVLATPQHNKITNIAQIKRVATQYPEITRRFFIQAGQDVVVIKSAGGTEVYPHILYQGTEIQAIIDLMVSGKSLAAHDLVRWEPPIITIHPVMIVNPQSLEHIHLNSDLCL